MSTIKDMLHQRNEQKKDFRHMLEEVKRNVMPLNADVIAKSSSEDGMLFGNDLDGRLGEWASLAKNLDQKELAIVARNSKSPTIDIGIALNPNTSKGTLEYLTNKSYGDYMAPFDKYPEMYTKDGAAKFHNVVNFLGKKMQSIASKKLQENFNTIKKTLGMSIGG